MGGGGGGTHLAIVVDGRRVWGRWWDCDGEVRGEFVVGYELVVFGAREFV